VSYEITDGNDEGYFALNEAGDAIVLTDDGAQAIRNGQFDPAGASVTVTGTQDVDSFTLTDEDVAGLEEVPTPEPTLTVGLELVDGTTDGWPQSAAENDVVFEVTTDLDLDGIDGDLAGEIALSLNEDSGGYLALDGNNVVLTDAGAEAIRNGQVSGNELAAEVEGTVTIADGGVNPFVLTDDAQAAIEVPVPDSDPVPGPEITGLGDTDVTVDEANLANGTNPDEDALTQNGQFTITASAGVASLTFAGSDFNQTFNIDQLNDASEANPLSVDTSKGTLEITGFTGNDDGIYTVTYSYTLTDAADHPEQGRDELQKDAINVTVTDTNGGTANDAVNVTIVDDVPVVEDSTTGVLSTEAGTTLTGDSGLRIGADVDGASITSFTINEAYIDHDDGKDYILVDSGTPGETTNLTSGGEKVWFESSDGTLTGFIGEDTVVFTALLDVETGLYTVSLQKDLDAINAEDLGFFAPQNGGNTGEVMESAGSDLAIRFTATDSGGDPTSVNFSANSFGVGSGPRIGSGETLKAEFVQAGTTDVRETLQSLELETWGEQGPGANVAWSVFLDGELVGDGTGTTVSGVGAFDEIHISHGPGSGNFGIGGFGSLVGEGSGFSIPFEFEAMDGDGDPLGSDGGSDSGAFDLTFSPNNVFEGSSDSDVIIGTDDDDILIGGGGDDILTGGAGDDIFRWNAGDEGTSDAPANDVVTDFGNGDNVLDLKDLLQGESEENIADYIIAEQEGADTKLYVNSQGGLNGDTDNANQVITLKDVQYSDDIVKDMLDSGQLTIDQ
uniref:type I secretion C-terminal target domain-containing protein n=1 Tax=unclassified Thioalkalivibrio TaxID=2621013 RepID=UPI000369B0E9